MVDSENIVVRLVPIVHTLSTDPNVLSESERSLYRDAPHFQTLYYCY